MKKILVLLLSLFMVVNATMTVFAESNEPKVEFTGVVDGGTYRVGQTVEFGIKTTGKYDVNNVVGVGMGEPEGMSNICYKYGESWVPFSGDQFGSSTGFAFTETESNFKGTFSNEGDYSWKITMKDVVSGSGVCETEINVHVVYDAKIGETKYATLLDAIENVQSGETIEMLRDVDDANGISVPENKNFTVDFNGKTYKVEKPGAGSSGTKTQAFQLLKGSTITFKNGTIACTDANKDFTWTGDSAIKGVAMIIQNYANLTLDNMTIDGTNIAHNGSNVRYIMSNNCGNVVYNNTTVIAPSGDFAFDSCKYGSYDAPTVTVKGNSNITGKVEATGGDIVFENGTVVNGQVRVGQNKSGGVTGSTVTVKNGAKIKNHGGCALVAFGENTLNVAGEVDGYIATNGNAYNAGSIINILNGAKVENAGDVAIYMPNGTLNISGGEITGATAVYFKSTTLNITGGTLIGNGTKTDYQFNGNGGDATGDALVIDACNYPSGIHGISVTGGNFKSVNAKDIASYHGNGVTQSVSGFVSMSGTTKPYFANDIELELIADGYAKAPSDKAGYKYTLKAVESVSGKDVKVSEDVDKITSVQGADQKVVLDNLNKAESSDISCALKGSAADKIISDATQSYSGEINKVELKVIVKVHAVEASISGTASANQTLVFDVKPIAEVWVNGARYDTTNISNGDLNGAKISVTLPTCGIVPVEVVHRTSGGAYIEKFTGSDMHYDPQNETVTVEIDSFSKLEINAFVTPVPVKHHSYTIVNTGVK